MLSDILDLENGIIVNMHIRSIDQSEAIKTIKRKITDLDKMKIEEQKKAVRSGYDMDIIPSDLATFGSEAKNLLQDLQSRNERMFLLTFLVVNMADTKRKLDNDVFATAGFAQKNNCALTRLDYLQEAGFMSSIPLGENLIPIQRGLTTSSTAIFIPFITQELFQRGAALYYGLNALSNNMILCDRKQLKNPNGLILGTPGSGKSFAAKREMTNAFLITDDDIIICDPEAEYFSLVQRLGGQVIRLSPAGKGMDGKPQYVNPMDINLNYSEDDNPLALKSDFILSLCELVIGGKEGLQPVEKTVIDRAVRNVYRPFLADPDPAKMPILGDLYNELLKQPEPEAARIAAALELYVSGSLNVFNHRTNVELSNRLVCFDIKQLGKQLKKLGIAMQKPDASLVAGFSAWKNNFGRNVIKGQKGIKIIAPSPYKVKQEMKKIDPHTQQPIIGKDGKPVTEEKEITIPAYKVVSVFDVSQTEGRELPDIAVNELTGDVERYRDFFAALEKTSPVPIGFEQIPGSSHGYYHLEDKRIAIDEGMSEIQTLKTAIHEIAHAKLHDIDLNAPENEQQPHIDRRTREVEAESVAYTVCQHYGLDTSDYSFGYVAGWSSGRELSELKSSLETIRSAAAEIINSIDETLAELSKAQDKEQTAGQEQPDKEENAAPEQPKQEASAQEKAAFIPETVYRVRRNPYSDRKENAYLLQAYVTQENGRAKMGAVLFTGTPQKCRELMGQLKSGELTEGQVKELYAKAQETAKTAEQDKGTFSIYQLKHGDETRDLRFEPYDRLQATGNVVDKANYELVYSAELTPGTSLEDIYTRFNIDHPKDFKGHSLSVSDVVVLHQNGQDAAHYVDSFGYKNVPEFLQEQKQLTPDELETGETIKTPRGTFYVTDMSREQMEAAGYGFHHQSDDGKYLVMGNGTRAFAIAAEQRENPLKAAEQTTEQNENMIDGIINNTPTVDELEAKVKAGETISLVDLANAVKADKERGKGKPEKKPSIRAQLKADKEKAQKKAAAKTKNHDLEV